MSLSWFLTFVLASLMLLLLFAGRVIYWKRPAQPQHSQKIIALFTVAISLILGWMIWHFIGWGTTGSPQVPNNLQRRLAHTGYYFGRNRELTFRGANKSAASQLIRASGDGINQDMEQRDIISRLLPDEALSALGEQVSDKVQPIVPSSNIPNLGFVNAALQPGELLTLKPIWIGDQAREWNLTYQLKNLPLRISATENGEPVKCINIPLDRWLNSGDTIFITRVIGGQTRFTSFRWTSAIKYQGWGPLQRTANSYYYGEGTIGADGLAQYTKGPDVLMSEVILSDGAVLAHLVRRAKQKFRGEIGSIDQEWWSVFSGLMLIRENRDDRNSRLGLIVAEKLFQDPAVQIYLNYSGFGSQPIALANDIAKIVTVPTGAKVSYGLRGRENSFELKLPGEVASDKIWGQIVEVSLAQPKVWPVPPKPTDEFIITTTNEYIPLDGFLIETGNPHHAFYAKGQLNEALDELTINDGKNVIKTVSKDGGSTLEPRRFELGKAATLGDYDQGILFGLLPSQSPERPTWFASWLAPQYTGRAAILLVMLNGLVFLVLLRTENHNRPTFLLAWSVIWGIGLTLLSVRLILIYRASLVPPLDASVREIRNVFDKGVDYTLLSLLVFALLTGALNFARRPSWQLNLRKRRLYVFVAIWTLIVVGYTVAGARLGNNQAFLGVRISIADHLLLVGVLAILMRPLLEHARLWTILLILLTIVLEVAVVKDAGSIIYSWSLLFVIIGIWGWRKPRRVISNWITNKIARFPRAQKLQRWLFRPFSGRRISSIWHSLTEWGTPIVVPIVAVSTLLFLPYLIQSGWMRKVVEPAVPDTTFYRFASFTDSEDVMLTTKSGEEVTDMSKLLDNSLQHWQMLLYASHGVASPVGYGRAPLSRVGMTYPTSVSDCAFATYVLAEHGRVTAILLLALYLLLGCTCVVAAWRFGDNFRHRNVVFIAIGGFFIFNALYMASANVGLMTFTGQNLPMLGLASGGDLLQGLVLLGLAGWLLLNTQQESKASLLWQRSPVVFRWGVGLCLVSLVWFGAVTWRMGTINNSSYRDNHDLKPATLERIAADLPRSDSSGPDRNIPLVLTGETLERDKGAPITEVEEQYRKQFNERTDKFNPQGGLYYLERVRAANSSQQLAVKINRRFFFAQSPFRDLVQWRGRIVAGGDRDPTLYALGSQFKISLSMGGLPASIDLGKPAPTRTNSSVLLREDALQFFQLERTGDRLTLHPKSGNWSVYVNGQAVTQPTTLEPLSIIVIERHEEDRQRRNLIYLGPTGPILAYVRWRNGGYRRMFPEDNITLPYMLGKAADRAVAMEIEANIKENERIRPELALTLDLPLHKKLQQELTLYGGTHSNYQPYRIYPNRLSATVMDAFDGRVLAIPSWPLLDQNKPQYETLIDKVFEPARSRFENNGNLIADHVVGSTIKPVIFATLAAQLWPERDIGQFRIFNRTDQLHASAGSSHPHWNVGGINIDVWDCNSARPESDMKDFIIHSLDYPEGLLGMMGMITDKTEMNQVLVRNDRNPDLSYGQSGYQLDLKRVGGRSVFTLQDQNDGKLPFPLAAEFINNSVLFSGLNSVFDFKTNGMADERAQRSCFTFMPGFANPNLSLSKNNYLDNVLAKRLEMSDGDFKGVRQGLISCFLGGAPCAFNNVMMAEAAARLATGKRVFANIEATPSRSIVDLPPPLNNSIWRNNNMITPMEQVGMVGTGSALSGRSRVNLPANYRVIYKTGTIVEGNEGRESEALMFVIGRWENGTFVRGETVAGFLYMEKSKHKDPGARDGDMKKFELAAKLINATIRHLSWNQVRPS